jgi:hypothetical protein
MRTLKIADVLRGYCWCLCHEQASFSEMLQVHRTVLFVRRGSCGGSREKEFLRGGVVKTYCDLDLMNQSLSGMALYGCDLKMTDLCS